LRATILDPSTRAAGQLINLGTGQWNESVPGLAMDSCNGFLLAWTDGREAAHSLYSRKYYYPAVSQGDLMTADIAPGSFYKWNRLENRQAMQSRAANYMYINYSTDGGKSWVPLPPNGSLDRAGRAPAIRIKVDMGTYDYSTSPVLSLMALNYTMNTLPSVSSAGPLSAWRNKPTTIDIRGSDGDDDSLTYTWEQIDGPPVAGTNTRGPSLPVDTGRPGTYRFRVRADDGWNLSLPCDVVLSVVNHGPSLSCPADPVEISRGGMVSIKAAGSDVDGDRVQILWSQMSGTPKLFQNFSGTELRFIASGAGEYRVQAIAYDGANYSAPILIQVSVDDPAAAEAAAQGQMTAASIAASAVMVAAAVAYLFMRRRRLARPA